MNKICSKCGCTKNLDQFPKRYNACKSCRQLYIKAWRHNRGISKHFRGEPYANLTGKTSGLLTIVGLVEGKKIHKQFVWMAKCECGNTTEVITSRFLNSTKQSCGCLLRRKKDQSPNWHGIGELSSVRYKLMKNKAKRRGIEFTISHEFLWKLFQSQNGLCCLSGEVIDLGSSKKDYGTASLDRIDSSKGYTKDNVQWVHRTVNFMKQSLKDEELISWCKKILQHRFPTYVCERNYE